MVGKAVKGDARSTALLIKLMEQFGLSKPDGEQNTPLVVQIVRFSKKPLPSCPPSARIGQNSAG